MKGLLKRNIEKHIIRIMNDFSSSSVIQKVFYSLQLLICCAYMYMVLFQCSPKFVNSEYFYIEYTCTCLCMHANFFYTIY